MYLKYMKTIRSFFYKKLRHLTISGFTLVELIVVLGLFSSIATLSLGSLFNAQTINSRLQETQAILDNINLSVQTLTRDLRFGTEFYCGTSLPAVIPTVRRSCSSISTEGGSVLIFKSSDSVLDIDRVAYYVSNGTLYKDEYINGATTTLQMTSNEVAIDTLHFYVEGAQSSDGANDYLNASDFDQPLITLLISGSTKSSHKSVTPVTFSIQTSISANEVDNK